MNIQHQGVNGSMHTFVQPRPKPLAPELDIFNLSECGEDLRKMVLVDVPRESPDVYLGWWWRR